MNAFIVIDTETTGLDARSDKLVEIAAVRLKHGRAFEFFYTLINPGSPIPPAASSIHHITDSIVARSPSWDEVRGEFSSFVGESPIVAHNASFDRNFLSEFQRHTWLCNYRLSLHLWPEAPSHANQALRYWLGIELEVDKAHRALDDARVTTALFQYGLQLLEQKKVSLSPLSLQQYIDALIPIATMPNGKHRGPPLSELPDSYLNWALENTFDDEDLRASLRTEHQRRGNPPRLF
jgi:DNA polymerase III epsilon subunit family exonuclease